MLDGLMAAAFVAAAWTAIRSQRASSRSAGSGEIVWSAVAAVILAGVMTAVRLGGSHGG